MFARHGLQEVRVWLSDKAHPSLPPYSTEAEIAASDASDRWRAEGVGPYDREEMRANVIAGGGSEAFFEVAWPDHLNQDHKITHAAGDQTWNAAGGVLFYVVAGRRSIS